MDFLKDDSPMPYGKHKGTRMIDVPAKDLIWLYENQRCSAQVMRYVVDNMDVLQEEIKRENEQKR